MKLCIDCEYNKSDLFCKAPCNGESPIDGEPKPVFLITARTTGLCGREAKYFMQTNPTVVKSWWHKLWNT